MPVCPRLFFVVFLTLSSAAQSLGAEDEGEQITKELILPGQWAHRTALGNPVPSP